MSKEIDHGVIETEVREDTNADPQGAAVRATTKIGTPLRVQEEFEWMYTGKALHKCVVATGNHPGALSLIPQYESMDAAAFDTVLKAADETARNMFEAALVMYKAERSNDKNWYMRALPQTISTLTSQVNEAWVASREKALLGTISEDAKDALTAKVESYKGFLFDDSQLNWFLMKNNAQSLVNQGLQEASAGIRRVLSANDWYERAVKGDKTDQIDNALSMQEDGRNQKMNGIVQALAISMIFDTLVTDDRAYPLRFSAENGAREALRFEAYQNGRKFAHPGMSEKQASAATAGNDVLVKDAIGGI